MSLTDKTLSGFLWASAERFGVQAMQMVIFIVLARLLTPEAFGLMGMLAVFIAVSRSIADSGFAQALIQKKETDERDYSSVFYVNLSVSIIIYGLLFATAPYIADFYGEPLLLDLVRVLGIKFVIGAFSMVQVARLTKQVAFKKLMIAKLPSTLIGGIAGIGSAYMGLGVWSLIVQQITDETLYTVQIWIQSKWKPRRVFDWKRVKDLFDFGWKMMLEGILNRIYTNFYEVMIGRHFSSAQVGFYNTANKIKQLPIQNISSALSRVSFPVLSEIQDDDVRLKRAYKKILRKIFLIVTPIMVGGIVLADPLFSLVLTDKWLPAVPYFQWLCISGLFYPANAYNLNILKVKGRSDLFLGLGLIKKAIAIIGIVIFVQFSVLALVIFRAFFSVFGYGINSWFSGKFIDYNIIEQFVDIWKILLSGTIMGGGLWLLVRFVTIGDFGIIAVGVLTGIVIYSILIYLVERKLLQQSISLAANFIRERL